MEPKITLNQISCSYKNCFVTSRLNEKRNDWRGLGLLKIVKHLVAERHLVVKSKKHEKYYILISDVTGDRTDVTLQT